VARALGRADRADLKLLMVEATAPGGSDLASIVDARTLVLLNKIDLLAGRQLPDLPWSSLPVSLLTGAGMDRLSDELTARVRALFEEGGPAPVVTRARHRAALADCVEALRRAGAAPAPELIAEDLRLAARALGRVTGQVDVEELLDRIFRDFCIGK
jgi:tRNA modification GTPase